MKILTFVDTHGNQTAIKRLANLSKKADLLICAGDLTEFGANLNEYLKIGLFIVHSETSKNFSQHRSSTPVFPKAFLLFTRKSLLNSYSLTTMNTEKAIIISFSHFKLFSINLKISSLTLSFSCPMVIM